MLSVFEEQQGGQCGEGRRWGGGGPGHAGPGGRGEDSVNSLDGRVRSTRGVRRAE